MLREVRSVAYRLTGTELEALLLESRLIKSIRPPYNRALLDYRGGLHLAVTLGDEAPRLVVAAVPPEGTIRTFGPLPGAALAIPAAQILSRMLGLRSCDDRRYARRRSCMAAELGHCAAPCVRGAGPQYRERVLRLLAFLEGNDASLLDEVADRMKQAAADLRFERAAALRDEYRILCRLFDRARAFGMVPAAHRELILLPGIDGNPTEAHAIRSGLHAGAVLLQGAPEDSERLERLLRNAERRCFPSPDDFGDIEAEEIRILRAWMGRNRERLIRIGWPEETDPARFAGTAVRTIERNPVDGESGFLDFSSSPA